MTSKAVFGDDAVTHPITGMMLENGKGAGTEAQQVEAHLGYIEKTEGKKAADAMRARVEAYNAEVAADKADPSARHAEEVAALEQQQADEMAALKAKQEAEAEAAREAAAAEEPTPEPLPPSAFTVPAEKPVEIK
jgi:alkyl hydroperoxide reductase subunit AhpF